MSKSLKTVQTVCKVCKVLAEIAFVMFVVIVALMLAATIFTGTGKLDALVSSGGVVLDDMLQQTGVTQEYVTAVLVCMTIIIAAEAVVAKFINVYFKHELKAGTPFTFEGAKEMLRLGIITIAVPVGASLVATIVFGIMAAGSGLDSEFNFEISLGMGLMFLALSPLLKHGTELRLRAQNAEEKLAEVKPADSEEDNL
ncbi:MAG TPA: hypothetical protein DIT84_03370 [Clostridiales bacterium]|nr:hypothetical protein [Clostridiales bacterium]